MSTRLVAADVNPERGVMLRLDFTHTQIPWTAPLLFSPPHTEARVRYDLMSLSLYDMISRCSLPVRHAPAPLSCTIRSHVLFVYDINLGATTTTILGIRGVQIPIYLVTSTTDSLGGA